MPQDNEYHSKPERRQPLRRLWTVISNRRFRRSLLLIVICIVLLVSTCSYMIALWYQHSQNGKPYQIGATFIPSYAQYLGVDPHATLTALITDLGVRQFRLVSYWDQIETSPGHYDFSELDWEFQQIEKVHGTVSLAVGLRQPRWPECHAPTFYDTSQPLSTWQPQLFNFMTAVVNRYKQSSALVSYQLENEFLNSFGECHNYDRSRLSAELALLQNDDPSHPVIISRSDNWSGFAVRSPRSNTTGISVYRRVWNTIGPHMYTEYPFPSWYYAFLAGGQKLLTGQDSIIHELQMEPWPPDGKGMRDISLAEQNKTFNAAIFRSNLEFAKQTGIHHIDLWGAEYWYYRWKIEGDPSVWQAAKQVFQNPAHS